MIKQDAYADERQLTSKNILLVTTRDAAEAIITVTIKSLTHFMNNSFSEFICRNLANVAK